MKTVKLTDEEWFRVFVSGQFGGFPLAWIEQDGHPDKRVTFLENADGGQAQLS